MKKTVSLLLCLLLTLGMAAALSACAPASILGSWTTTIDYSEQLRAMLLEGAEDFEPYFSVPSFPVRLNAVFSDDATYVITVDELELNNTYAEIEESLKEAINAYFSDKGWDAETLESRGTSVYTAMQFFYLKRPVPTICETFYVSGTYKLDPESGKILISDHPTNLPDGSSYASVDVTKKELSFTDGRVSFETVPQLADAFNAGLRFTRTE